MSTLRLAQLAHSSIMIRVPNWIGDAVMCLPALQELRRAVPQADLTLVGRPWVLDIFPAVEMNARTISYDTRKQYRGLAGRWRFVEQLRNESFDAAILFQNALDAAAVTAVAGIPIRAGYARDGRGPLLTHPVTPPRERETPPHETYYYLELLHRLEIISSLPDVEEIHLRARTPDRESARKEISKFIPPQYSGAPLLVGLGAGASFGTAKRWPADRFAEVAARLGEETGTTAVFFGSADENEVIESLLPKAGKLAVSLAGKTSLQDFIRLAPACDLYITNDTGTMHVAAALGVPTLAIFGPTDEHGTRPLGPYTRVLTGEAECRPCKLRHCPIDHRCMTSISVETVLHAARNMMAQ